MPTTTTVPADPTVGGHPTTHGGRIVAALAITQTVGYGTLYAYAVLLAPMATTLGTSTTAVAAASLPALGASPVGAVVAVVAFGLGFGVSSLATPTLLADRYGTTAYASIAGILALPVTISRATAPLATAALLHAAGYQSLLIAVAVCCAIAAVGMFLRAGSPPPDWRDR